MPNLKINHVKVISKTIPSFLARGPTYNDTFAIITKGNK